jgi:hypothetical protein
MNERPMKNIFENTFPYLLKNMHLLGYSLLSGVGLLTPFAPQTSAHKGELNITSENIDHICAHWARIGGLERNIPKELGQLIKEFTWEGPLPHFILNRNTDVSLWLQEFNVARLTVGVKEYFIALDKECPWFYAKTILKTKNQKSEEKQEEGKFYYFKINTDKGGDTRCITANSYNKIKNEGGGLQVSARSVIPPKELVFIIHQPFGARHRYTYEREAPLSPGSGCYRSSVSKEWGPLCIKDGTRHPYVFYRNGVGHGPYPPTNALETEEPPRVLAAVSSGLSLLQVAVVGIGVGFSFMAYRWTKK